MKGKIILGGLVFVLAVVLVIGLTPMKHPLVFDFNADEPVVYTELGLEESEGGLQAIV